MYHANTTEYKRNSLLYFISSADLKRLAHDLRLFDLQFFLVNGAWQGIPEQAYCIVNTGRGPDGQTRGDTAIEKYLRYVAIQHGQDAILKVGLRNEATLLVGLDSEQSIGYWHSVSQDEALQADAYTEYNGQYYLAKR